MKKITFDFSTTVETYSINQFFVRKKVVIQTTSRVRGQKQKILHTDDDCYIHKSPDWQRKIDVLRKKKKKALINVEITLLSPPTKKKQYKPTHVLLEKKISRKENKRKNEEKSKPNLFLRCESWNFIISSQNIQCFSAWN